MNFIILLDSQCHFFILQWRGYSTVASYIPSLFFHKVLTTYEKVITILDLCIHWFVASYSWWPNHHWPPFRGICFLEHNSLWCGDHSFYDTYNKAHLVFPPLLAHVCTRAVPPRHPSPRLLGCCIALLLRQKKGGVMPLPSLFLPLVAFFGSFTIAISTFLLSCFQGFLGALGICEVKPLVGFLTEMLVLLDASTNLVKYGICRFSR